MRSLLVALCLAGCSSRPVEIVVAPDPLSDAMNAYATLFHAPDARTVWTAPVRGDHVVVALWTGQLQLEKCELALEAGDALVAGATESRVVATPTGEDLVLSARFDPATIRTTRAVVACEQRWPLDGAADATLEALANARETGE